MSGSTLRAVVTAVCVLGFLLAPSPGTADTLPGAISCWKADGDGLDSVGSNHASLYGGAAFAAGLDGQAFDLTASGDRVQMAQPFPSMSVGDDFTVSLWMNVASPSPIYGVLFETRLNNYYGFTIGVQADGVLWITGRCDNSDTGLSCTGPAVGAGEWHHVAAVFNWVSGALEFYVDGALVDTGSLSACNGFTRSDKIYLGSTSLVNPDWEFAGFIDEVHIYDRALDGLEIGTLPVESQSWGSVKSLYRQ